MLERVALGQTRFSTPGVAADSRGVVVGRLGALLFPSLDGLVGWLRLFSDEASLDDVGAELRIMRVRTPLASRAFLLQLPATSSYILDRAARCARLVGGATYTGSARHFVKYRDERSPYGYDVGELAAAPEGADFLFYGEGGPQTYSIEGELDLRSLVFRLTLQRVPWRRVDRDERHPELFLTAQLGLASGVIRYLWRAHVRAEVALVAGTDTRLFSREGLDSRYFLMRIHDVPGRVTDNFRGVPGLAVYRPVTSQVGVELGWQHPLSLGSCTSLFDPTRVYLFSGQHNRVDVVPGPVEFSSSERLTSIALGQSTTEDIATPVDAEDDIGLAIRLRLEPTLAPARRVVATLLAWSEAPRLKKLVYALPPSMLRGHRMGASERGILLVAKEGVDLVPLGTLLSEVAPGLLVPLGMDLVPRVAPEVLAQILGHGAGRISIYPVEGGPFFVKEADLVSLERKALAQLPVPEAALQSDVLASRPLADATLVNDPVGAFALWRYPVPPGREGR